VNDVVDVERVIEVLDICAPTDEAVALSARGSIEDHSPCRRERWAPTARCMYIVGIVIDLIISLFCSSNQP